MNVDALTVKEMLKNGTTAETLMEELKKQIKEAEEEIAADNQKKLEEEKDEKVELARVGVIEAIVEYMDAMDIMDADGVTEEDINDFADILKEIEEKMREEAEMIRALNSMIRAGKKSVATVSRDKEATVKVKDPLLSEDILKAFVSKW